MFVAVDKTKPILRVDRNRLTMRRQLAGLSQQGLADRAGTNQPRISRIEAGRESPGPKSIKKLADALDCKVEDIASFDLAAHAS